MKQYLESSKYIDWNNTQVLEVAKAISNNCVTEDEIVNACFIFVRDEIQHSNDYKLNPITVSASEVLKNRTGYCYSKSHLLAALLRANSIPAGLCYQRLTIEDNKPPFCLHGLNAVFLRKYGWYRIDPRGNKPGVNAQYCPPLEKLAFQIISEGECDLNGIWPEPLSIVIDVLKKHKTYLEVMQNLPDIEVIKN